MFPLSLRNWQIFWCASRPASACRVQWPPSWKTCLTIQLSFGFWGCAVEAFDTFPESWHDYWKQYFRSFGRGICLPDSPNWRYRPVQQVKAQLDCGPGSEIGVGWKIGVTWSRKRGFKMAATELGYLLTKLSFWLSLWRDISISWHGGKEL